MIKPDFFDDPDVADLSPMARLFFIGLWLQADREGRVIDDMRRLKARIFPYDTVDCEALAVELHGKNMIRRYQDVEKHGFIWIRNFLKHQRPHPKESESLIPPYTEEAVKKHGKPLKKTERTPDPKSGSLILDPTSGIQASADADYARFMGAYPLNRRVGGKVGRRAYDSAARTLSEKENGRHLEIMLTALEQQKHSDQWQTPKLIPLMTTWLNQERWNQILPTVGSSLRMAERAPVFSRKPGWMCPVCQVEHPAAMRDCSRGQKRPA